MLKISFIKKIKIKTVLITSISIQLLGIANKKKKQIFIATNDYFSKCLENKRLFFWFDNKNKRPLCTIYLFLKNARSMRPEVLFKKGKHLFRRTLLGDCSWNIWKCFPLLFCHFTIFPEVIPQWNSRSSLPDAFLKKDTS